MGTLFKFEEQHRNDLDNLYQITQRNIDDINHLVLTAIDDDSLDIEERWEIAKKYIIIEDNYLACVPSINIDMFERFNTKDYLDVIGNCPTRIGYNRMTYYVYSYLYYTDSNDMMNVKHPIYAWDLVDLLKQKIDTEEGIKFEYNKEAKIKFTDEKGKEGVKITWEADTQFFTKVDLKQLKKFILDHRHFKFMLK